MHKKLLITLLILFTPIAFIEQNKHNKSSQLDNAKFNSLIVSDINNHSLTNLLGELITTNVFNTNERNRIDIKYCWEEGDLESQKRYCSSTEDSLYKF